MKITKNKNKKGISLIVLIITIAVIIILATAVILSIANNRPIESAKEATTSHNESVLLESAAVLSAQWKTDSLLGKTELSRSDYVKEGLKNQGFTEDEIGGIVVDDKTGETKKIEKGGALDVASNPQKYYGKEVTNYTESSGSNVGWKIFYADKSNIYLIADDYIPYDSIPNSTSSSGSTTDNKPNQGPSYYPASASFTAVLKDYTGSESIDTSLQKLNSKYFKYLSDNSTTSENSNMKAVAYMLDKEAWKNFKGDKAEYAIGGPTSEIFIDSWNAKYPDLKIEYQVADVGSYKADYGYSYKKESSGSWNYLVSSAFSKSDSLYVITSTSKAFAMWLASPSCYNASNLSNVPCSSAMSNDYYTSQRSWLSSVSLSTI